MCKRQEACEKEDLKPHCRWAGGMWKREGGGWMGLSGRQLVIGVTQKAGEPVA